MYTQSENPENLLIKSAQQNSHFRVIIKECHIQMVTAGNRKKNLSNMAELQIHINRHVYISSVSH